MNGYIALYRGKQIEVHSDSLMGAKIAAVAQFKAAAGRRANSLKSYEVSVYLAEKGGETVTQVSS